MIYSAIVSFVLPVWQVRVLLTRCLVLVRSEGGTECKQTADAVAIAARLSPNDDEWENQSNASERKGSPAR